MEKVGKGTHPPQILFVRHQKSTRTPQSHSTANDSPLNEQLQLISPVKAPGAPSLPPQPIPRHCGAAPVLGPGAGSEAFPSLEASLETRRVARRHSAAWSCKASAFRTSMLVIVEQEVVYVRLRLTIWLWRRPGDVAMKGQCRHFPCILAWPQVVAETVKVTKSLKVLDLRENSLGDDEVKAPYWVPQGGLLDVRLLVSLAKSCLRPSHVFQKRLDRLVELIFVSCWLY